MRCPLRVFAIIVLGWGLSITANARAQSEEVAILFVGAWGVAPSSPPTDPTPVETVEVKPSSPSISAEVTYYHPSLEGGVMGCGGSYHAADPSIVAVSLSMDRSWPCGTTFTIEGPAGAIQARRQDSCGGCGSSHLDLSSAGFISVCGSLSRGRCAVSVRVDS